MKRLLFYCFIIFSASLFSQENRGKKDSLSKDDSSAYLRAEKIDMRNPQKQTTSKTILMQEPKTKKVNLNKKYDESGHLINESVDINLKKH